jgi:hypothetical protein
MTIPYSPQTWVDGSGGGTPVSAARLNTIEAGIRDAHFQPAVRVTHNANQSTTNTVAFTVAFNTEAFDQASNASDTMHDTVTNNSRLTCRYAGVYDIKAQIEWAASATGQRTVAIKLNGATQIGLANQDATAGGGTTSQICQVLYSLAVNDYVEVLVTQSSGGALNVLTSTNVIGPAFSMVRVA